MTTRKMQPPMGLYFEEFEIADSSESVGRTITETDIVNFAALSGDWNRIHTDAEYSKAQMFGQRVAHGLLVLSVASGLAVRMGFMEETVQAFTKLEWQFRRPILMGDTVRLRATVAEKKAMPRTGGGVVTFKMEVLNQKDEVCQRGSWEILCKSLPE
ncbi:MAG: MaoC family dehydratase N-terminal domain-containing protein [Chloroflexi bacterium]|nr:MaoC family dehydratase N-terminal domain-containing protein [Chloroflexota bacterium]